MTKFQQAFDKWLFSENKDYNPFTRFLAKSSEEYPNVPEPEISLEDIEENRAIEHQRNASSSNNNK